MLLRVWLRYKLGLVDCLCFWHWCFQRNKSQFSPPRQNSLTLGAGTATTALFSVPLRSSIGCTGQEWEDVVPVGNNTLLGLLGGLEQNLSDGCLPAKALQWDGRSGQWESYGGGSGKSTLAGWAWVAAGNCASVRQRAGHRQKCSGMVAEDSCKLDSSKLARWPWVKDLHCSSRETADTLVWVSTLVGQWVGSRQKHSERDPLFLCSKHLEINFGVKGKVYTIEFLVEFHCFIVHCFM